MNSQPDDIAVVRPERTSCSEKAVLSYASAPDRMPFRGESWASYRRIPSVRNWISILFLFFSLILSIDLQAQDQNVPSPPDRGELDYITVENIFISGNRRTRHDIILRELDFQKGDTLSIAGLVERLDRNQLFLMNTGLFTSARFSFKEWEGATNKVGIQIDLLESWYIYPFPILELADRNFNVWWDTYQRKLNRLNVGLRFYHTNITGRKDLLKTVIQFGFTKKYEVIYTLPAFNRDKTLGFNLNFLHTREKEIGYNTVGNELLFHRNDSSVLLQRFRLGCGLIYRKKQYGLHRFNLTYYHHIIDESVRQELNPHFFADAIRQKYLSLSYEFTYDKRDIRPYPMRGFLLSGGVSKDGLGLYEDLNAMDVWIRAQQYFSYKNRWSAALQWKGKIGLQREQQPYYNSRALGYFEDFIRGYEYYVIDGLDFTYFKGAIRFQLFDKSIHWGDYMKLPSYRTMPVKLFLVFHNEAGYVNNPFYRQNNSLANEWLWGTGAGLDLVLYYNKVINMEYSRNHLGERGFFLHWRISF